jgi:hypothetical protein
MSAQQTVTTYQFAFNYSDPTYENGFGFQISGQPGFGDAEAFALEAAITAALGKSAPLAPVGSVFKAQLATTQYQTNANATPPSFT